MELDNTTNDREKQIIYSIFFKALLILVFVFILFLVLNLSCAKKNNPTSSFAKWGMNFSMFQNILFKKKYLF